MPDTCGLQKPKNIEDEVIQSIIYLNIADVSSSPHHATLMLTARQRDWHFSFQRNFGT